MVRPGPRLPFPTADGASPRRILVLRALQLGDMLCAVPALRALRAAFPTAEIVLAGLPWARRFAGRFGRYLDGFREFPGHPALPEQPPRLAEWPAFLRDLQAGRFDLAVQMHGSGGVSNALVALLGARHTAGFYRPGQFCPEPALFTAYPDDLPEVRRHLRLMEHLGVPLQGDELEFPLSTEEEAEARRLDEAPPLAPGGYACVHPGARAAARRWPPEQFAAVADALAGQGLRVVLTGSGEERGLTGAVARAMRAPAVDTAGRLGLGAMAALLRDARLVVCNNTGVAHLTAALRVPSVVVFHEPAECDRWAPLDRRRHRPVVGFDGARRAVLAEADDLLRDAAGRVA